MNQIERALKRPFPVAKVSFRAGPGGKELAYITARDVMDRLDEVFGPEGWQTRYEWLGNRMICYISCRVDGNWISKSDGADDTQIEAAKGGISDALKRAGVLWGIGRLYYHPGCFNANREAAYWATPEGYDALMDDREDGEIAGWTKELKENDKKRG